MWGMPDSAGCPPGFDSAVSLSSGFSFTPFSTSAVMASRTVMAFDFGTKRIGVAVGETASHLAHPLTTVFAGTNDARFDAVARLIDEWKPSLLLVGLPVHMDGTEHEMTALARRFARRLEGRFALPVEMIDERLSTSDATSRLHDAGVEARRQRPVRDQVAAQGMLQAWIDAYDR